MIVTDSGIVTVVNLAQFINEDMPIFVILGPNVTFVISILPPVITESGIAPV